MRELVRSMAIVGAVAMGTIGVVTYLDEDNEASVTLVVTVICLTVVIRLIRALAAATPTAWDLVPPLWRRGERARGPDVPEAVRQWDALIVSASTGERRARERLRRRLEPLAGPTTLSLLDGLPDASPEDVVPIVERLVEELEHVEG